MKEPIWRPTAERIKNSNLTTYQKFLADTYSLKFTDFAQLYQWSITDIPKFWESIWKYADVVHSHSYERINEGWGRRA